MDKGGQGLVYLVVDSTRDRKGKYVLKKLKAPKRRERFVRDVNSLRKLAFSEYIVPIIDFSVDDPTDSWYVMPKANRNLEVAVHNGDVDMDLALRFFEHICRGVRDAHSVGIIHRDLKPANILLFDAIAKVADFGLAFVDDDPRFTPSAEVVGPRFFMAPELEDGRLKDVGPWTDVYSLGKLLYFLLTRGVWFAREKHLSREYNLESKAFDPRAKLFESLLNKSITRYPHDRFKDSAGMYGAFIRILESYRAHPRTRILARSASLDVACNASESELMSLPGSELSTILDHVTSSETIVPQAALLNAATTRLDDPEVFRSASKCLLAREQEFDPDTVTDLAAALVTSAPGNSSIMMASSIVGERRIMELATRNGDLNVLNALMSRTQFGLKSFPIVVERLAKQVRLLSPEARRNFVVSTYRIGWTDKEEFLMQYVDTCEDPLEFEAAIAGLCQCGTPTALAKVDQFKQKAMAEERLGAFLRGIVWRT